MDSAIVALLGSAVLAFVVRFFNVVLEWLARILAVKSPEPIANVFERNSQQSIDRPIKTVVETSKEAPDPGKQPPSLDQ